MTQPPDSSDPSQLPPTIPYAGGSAPVRASAISPPPAPAPPPRPISPAANRRSWSEPIVRFWLLATTALIAIGIWFFTQQFLDARRQQWLITNGTVVNNAIAIDTNGDDLHPIPVGSTVTLKFDWHGEQTVVYGVLNSQTVSIAPGKAIPFPLHVNPSDPSDWTDRQEPESLIHRLATGTVIVAAAAITALATLLLRRRLLHIWRDADAVLFSVVDTRHTALAPLSHTVRCVSAVGRDPTIVTVFLPTRFPRPQPGELLWLIHRTGKPKSAVAAAAYE
ncbi:MAG TPA: hypothetical protein VGG44_10715 [Tepidisphaeraceae bacterium]